MSGPQRDAVRDLVVSGRREWMTAWMRENAYDPIAAWKAWNTAFPDQRVSWDTARNDFKTIKRLLEEATMLGAIAVRGMNFTRIEKLIQSHMPKALGGSLGATDRVLALIRTENEMFGANIPPKESIRMAEAEQSKSQTTLTDVDRFTALEQLLQSVQERMNQATFGATPTANEDSEDD